MVTNHKAPSCTMKSKDSALGNRSRISCSVDRRLIPATYSLFKLNSFNSYDCGGLQLLDRDLQRSEHNSTVIGISPKNLSPNDLRLDNAASGELYSISANLPNQEVNG